MYTFYVFLISTITLLVFYVSAGGAADYFIRLQEGSGFMSAERLMSSLGYAISGGVLWLFHWRLALKERSKHQTQDALLMAYLLLALFMFSMGLLFQGATVASEATSLLGGYSWASGTRLAAQAAYLLLSLVLWVHHMRLFMAQAQREVTVQASAETK